MNKLKKLLLLTLTALTFIFGAIAFASCGEKGTPTNQTPEPEQPTPNPEIISPTEGLEYTLNGDGNSYSCTGIGTCTETEIVIASTYEGKPVTAIGDMAFVGVDPQTMGPNFCSTLTSIIIPNSITSIGLGAFGFCNIENIELPDSVTSIGLAAFQSCESLTSINIPNNVTSIGDQAFMYCESLISIEIPDSVSSIGEHAFYDCNSLQNIIIGNGVISIGYRAFSNCYNLSGITVVQGNSVYRSEGNCLIEKATNTLVLGCKNSIIPNSLISIGELAFEGCSNLTSIEIPNSVTYIGEYAFQSCGALTIYCEIASQPSGWDSNWNSNWNMEKFPVVWNCKQNDVANDGYIYTIFDDLRYSIKDDEAMVARQADTIKTANIPSIITYKGAVYSVASISSSAFYGCSSLTSITVDAKNANYKSIDGNLYSKDGKTFIQYALGKTNTSFTIPDGVTSIGSSAFSGCSKLTSIKIPDSVTSIGEDAFAWCSSLTSIEIPDSVTSIGYYAFSGCSSLEEVHISDIAAWCKISFSGSYSNPLYYAENLYLNGELVTELVIPDGVTSIGEYAFYNCSSLTSIEIPDSVTSIGYYAFADCSSLTSITLPFVGATKDGSSYTHFGYIFGASDSYYNDDYVPTSLKTVIITGGTSIGNSAFYDCSSLTSIHIPNSVTYIGVYAFAYCSKLTKINFNGTMAEWIAIEKVPNWNIDTITYTVICTDGTLDISGNVITA